MRLTTVAGDFWLTDAFIFFLEKLSVYLFQFAKLITSKLQNSA